jgi:glycosyltransferase involved in cell wall biosynthesis
MKIGIYNQPSGNSIGGSEYSVAVLAEALRPFHEVEILHHRANMDSLQLTQLFNVNLDGVKIRYVEPESNCFEISKIPWLTRRGLRARHSELSGAYDLFFNFTHELPPYCQAATGILMVLFPFFVREKSWPWANNDAKSGLWHEFRQSLYNREWHERFASYTVKLANSNYSRIWAKRRWEIDCEVVYPPVDRLFGNVEKQNLVLSVGRFGGDHSKKQLEMVEAFRELGKETSWEYFSVGTLSENGPERDYFAQVKELAGARTYVVANLPKTRLQDLFERSKIFWHGAGFGVDQELHPEAAEHFGIVTVEAMAAGCVPLVQKKGGQPEIVEDGVSGLFWDSIKELNDCTKRLMNDPTLLERMARAAKVRATRFTKKNFLDGIFNSVPQLR